MSYIIKTSLYSSEWYCRLKCVTGLHIYSKVMLDPWYVVSCVDIETMLVYIVIPAVAFLSTYNSILIQCIHFLHIPFSELFFCFFDANVSALALVDIFYSISQPVTTSEYRCYASRIRGTKNCWLHVLSWIRQMFSTILFVMFYQYTLKENCIRKIALSVYVLATLVCVYFEMLFKCSLYSRNHETILNVVFVTLICVL